MKRPPGLANLTNLVLSPQRGGVHKRAWRSPAARTGGDTSARLPPCVRELGTGGDTSWCSDAMGGMCRGTQDWHTRLANNGWTKFTDHSGLNGSMYTRSRRRRTSGGGESVESVEYLKVLYRNGEMAELQLRMLNCTKLYRALRERAPNHVAQLLSANMCRGRESEPVGMVHMASAGEVRPAWGARVPDEAVRRCVVDMVRTRVFSRDFFFPNGKVNTGNLAFDYDTPGGGGGRLVARFLDLDDVDQFVLVRNEADPADLARLWTYVVCMCLSKPPPNKPGLLTLDSVLQHSQPLLR
tara:strand:- start:350 stop:1240 length:891 start_codon:yes stop_codon:yes gene_type:complete